jgi:hypothetical protein
MKRPHSKPRGDSVLKNLPDALQEQLFQFLRRNTQEKTLAWLRDTHGVGSNASALSGFFDWYPRQGWLKQSASIAEQLKGEVAKLPQLRADAKTVGDIAQVSFELLAAQNRDSKFFLELTRERREEKRLALEREKHEWAKKSDIEKALDAMQAEVSGDALALDLFQKLRARLLKLQEVREAST